MRKKTRSYLIISVIILVIMIIGFIGVSQTVFKGANRISCGDSGVFTWNCDVIGLGGVGTDMGKINFQITEPSNKEEYNNMRIDKVSDINQDIKKFYDTHKFFNKWGTIYRYTPNDVENKWDTRIAGITNVQLENDIYGWEVDTGKMYEETLGKQIVILEGTLTPQEQEKQPRKVKTWGLCQVDKRKCWVYDIPGAGIEDILTADSIIIYFKNGGYELSDACIEFGLDCPKDETKVKTLPDVEEAREGDEEISKDVAEETTDAIIPESEEKKIVEEIKQVVEEQKQTSTPSVSTGTTTESEKDRTTLYGIIGIIIIVVVLALVSLLIRNWIIKR